PSVDGGFWSDPLLYPNDPERGKSVRARPTRGGSRSTRRASQNTNGRMDWIHELPAAVVAAVMIACFAGGAIVGLGVSRQWSRRRGLHALVDNGVIGWMFSAILAIYAIAIGLIAVASWSNSSDAASAASHEAAEVAAFFRDVQGYPEPVQTELEQA